MLKALELTGFKSFADRTRFDFPSGISVVVGPNGSGKSNLVDAIKWVLGSQSAKSLRGKEMTDVIFNGAASRGPLGTGEVTLTLDNSDSRLPLDASEVHITRRVYRSGEGEYLINRQPSRLRDIRELLAGTGITTEAYCIIEQGRVDALLQSSPRDRRIIFEEAAGISQFKLKMSAAMRRLERVEQNLLRLSDIVDEVESRLRSVRTQAGKARRYREHATRLQHLRTQLGLADWRTFSRQVAVRDEQLAELRRRQETSESLVERFEAALAELERRLETRDQRLRELEAAASATREQIASRQAALEHLAVRRTDLEQDIAQYRRQLIALTCHAENATEVFHDVASQLHASEEELRNGQSALQQQLAQVENAQRDLDAFRHECDALQTEQATHAHSFTALEHQLTTLGSRLASASAERERSERLAATLQVDHNSMAADVAAYQQAEADLASQSEACQTTRRDTERQLAQVRQEFARMDKQCREVEGRLTRTHERIAVLTELEHRLEGLDTGVQDLLRWAREAPDGPLGQVCGIVADLIHVDVDTAPLVEVALGERAQFLVLSSASLLFARLEQQPLGTAGRVGFLRLDVRTPATAIDHVDLSSEPGVMGRADRFVETAPEYMPLVGRLLGRTWFVDRLRTALRLSQAVGRGLEFVTSDGELLTSDGTLVIGPRAAATGWLSRRSELRACQENVMALDQQLDHLTSTLAQQDARRSHLEQTVASLVVQHTELIAKLGQRREQTALATNRLEHLSGQIQQIAEKQFAADTEIAAVRAEAESARLEQTTARQAAEELQRTLQKRQQQIQMTERRLIALQAAATESTIIVAKGEQRVDILRAQLQQSQRDHQQRDQSLAETRQQIASRHAQLSELDEAMLVDRQSLADLFLQKERFAEELQRTLSADESLRRDRSELNEHTRAERRQLSILETQKHKLEVSTGNIRHDLQTLCDRMQDDYGINLAEEAASSQAIPGMEDIGPRDAVDREITELRNQLNNIGAVNLDALDELDELETRFGSLSQQYHDLVEAKASLERIIHRIHADSRQLFLTTLDEVRGHFQELFRRLFGGGEADIVLDEAEDVLECGIEIIARPPGKEACSISLLSGGEKTLTCVALLLAVFRSKPSPFCILDEVDAALDEANIGRFIQVLREFLSFTQFVVVSHSKRTMSGADTLYGVTMEESGVSKRVSVRFEDVSEDGQILLHGSRNEQASHAATSERSTPQARQAA